MNKEIALILLFVALNVPVQAFCENRIISSPLQAIVGENHQYSLDFLFLKRLGHGRLRFVPTDQPTFFRVELSGRTLGFAAWLSNYRTQTYSATMQQMPDGSFKSIEYVSEVKKRRNGQWKYDRRVFNFDHMAGKVVEKRIREDIVVSSKKHSIPEGQNPVDMLTAFYNLRTGTYGELESGKWVSIPTITTKGFSKIELKVLTAEEQQREKDFPHSGFLAQVKVPSEVFGTGKGHMYVWFDNNGIPAQGIIENMIGFGDVKGYLMEDRQ